MLDAFEVLTTSGIVLWSKKYVPTSPAIVNSLITNVFIEERTGASSADDIPAGNNPVYRYDKHTLKWTTSKELGLIFVAVYRSLLHLTWVDKLVDNIKTIFIELYGDQLRKPHSTIVECNFDEYFNRQIEELSKIVPSSHSLAANHVSQRSDDNPPLGPNLSDEPPQLPGLIYKDSIDQLQATESNDSSPILTPVISRSGTPAPHLLTDKTRVSRGRVSRKLRKAANSSSENIRSESSQTKNRTVKKKERKWDSNGLPDDLDDRQLDYSAHCTEGSMEKNHPEERLGNMEKIDHDSWGSKTSDDKFLLKDLDDQINHILASADATKTPKTTSNGLMGSSFNVIGSLFRNVVGGKTLTKDDLDKAMKSMEDHLLKKNVAREAAIRLCQGVEGELIGMKTGTFEGIQPKIRTAMESSLRKILTPCSSLDLLREVDTVISPKSISSKRRPYVISIVGVNGVGKSTSLSKICFFLLQNKYKVLIVACDTFRSGAVEQLAVHVKNLQELTDREGGFVQLYQKGYGKDAANVARDAVTFAAQEAYDVVLIDTAGRRHNDQRLMSSLEKFAKFANPDKILMVGEALVGTDSVAQARNFNAAFGRGRSLDGFIISKCDTVGDMVGTLVSMVHATNVPIVFVGIGQHYSDLRSMSVKWAVEKLLTSC